MEGNGVTIGPAYILPIPTAELPLDATIEQTAAQTQDPFTVILAGGKQPITLTPSGQFPPKAGITYLVVQLSAETAVLQDWEHPVLHLEWSAVDTSGKGTTLHRYYRIQKQ